jgi:arylsulfatase A-like enzyme
MREPEWSGTHRLHGILAMRGPAIREGARVEGARLIDLMPTLLYLLDVPIPAGLDGHVLSDAIRAEWQQAHPLAGAAQAAGALAAPLPGATPYTAEEAAEVEEHLRSLGYVD